MRIFNPPPGLTDADRAAWHARRAIQASALSLVLGIAAVVLVLLSGQA